MTDIKLKRTLATLTSLTPLTVLAHGEEVLVTIFLEFGLLLVFILILAYVKLKMVGKLLIGGLYLLTLYLTDKVIENWPYRQNMTLINFFVTIIPATVFLMSYFVLRKKFKKAD